MWAQVRAELVRRVDDMLACHEPLMHEALLVVGQKP